METIAGMARSVVVGVAAVGVEGGAVGGAVGGGEGDAGDARVAGVAGVAGVGVGVGGDAVDGGDAH